MNEGKDRVVHVDYGDEPSQSVGVLVPVFSEEKVRTLAEGLQEELARNRELLTAYSIVPMGALGAQVIRNKMKIAEAAMLQGNVADMIDAYKALKLSK